MLFNSLNFAIFLPIVFILYWFVFGKNLKKQNFLLLITSYVFYGFWDWRFLFLLAFSTGLDFFTGIKISEARTKKMKTIWLWLSIGINLGFLGFFKYYNFFISSFADFVSGFGFQVDTWTLSIILPVGISFYTFHGLSYVLDIYYNRIKPERNIIDYSVFVSFFPLLVAGPIERATHLLPQIKKARVFNYTQASDGMRQILWGLFKKIVIADNCSQIANLIFDPNSHYSGSSIIVGGVFFAFQIYGDFSGYSDIALGTARLLGIDLLRNFAFPYFSRDIAEFWRRWHISLSSWFRDYVYIPLGGSKGSIWMKIRNTFIIFILSGFWHGANWTFIAWGALNAIYFLPLMLSKSNRNHIEIVAKGKYLPSLKEMFMMLSTFCLTVIAWIFFRADNISYAFKSMSEIFSVSLFTIPDFPGKKNTYIPLILMFIFTVIEWFGREQQYAIADIGLKWKQYYRYAFYFLIIIVIVWYGGTEQQFIYFQF